MIDLRGSHLLPAPATGNSNTHTREQAALVNEALSVADLGNLPKPE